jgi:diguanylate cyclase (GGDEF)-like protein
MDNNRQPSPSVSVFSSPLLLAVISVLLLVGPAALLADYFISRYEQSIVEDTRYRGDALVATLEGKVEANVAVGRGFEAHISALGDLSDQELAALADRLIDPSLHIRHVALAPDLVVSAVYPLAGNEAALGLDYRSNMQQKQAAVRAIKSGQIILAGPLVLVQGGKKQLVARVPVYKRFGEPWGLVAIVIRFEALLSDAGFLTQDKYELALRGKDGLGDSGAAFWGDAALFENHGMRFPVEVPGGEWQLAIVPKAGWHAPVSLQVACWSFAFGVCALIGVIVYSVRKQLLEKQEYLQRLEDMAMVDPLTNLTSRFLLTRQVESLIAESDREQQGFAVLFVDLDHFKEINDSLGHAAGDKLLVEIAQRLRARTRPYDILSRLGGDEFIIVLKGITDPAEIKKRASYLTESFSKELIIADMDMAITASVGVAVYPNDGDNADTLIQNADRAMYEGKRVGRNALFFYDAEMGREAGRYINVVNAIKRALIEEQFEVYYQPIYDLNKQMFTRCEALCRWPNPERGMISPAEFIPTAEQSGLIRELGEWLSSQVLQCYRDLEAEGHDLNFSINRSPQEFHSPGHTQKLIELLNSSSVPASRITFEITESLLMTGSSITMDNFELLKSAGVNFSIDDFGTGYSAINYLRKYPVESLKIDRSFISGLGESEQAETLVQVIVQMAKTLGIAVVAEGVETQAQLDYLSNIGCDYIQGFYLAKPMSKSDLIAFLAEQQTACSQ